jgi:hypothetical protein
LHLWDRPDAAESFLARLKKDEEDRRWVVVEVDVEGTIDEILDPGNLRLPQNPRVVAIRSEPLDDPLGEDSLRVWVILEDATKKPERSWAAVEPIYRAIRDTLQAEGIPSHPDIVFRTESEFSKQRQKVS